MIIEVKEYVDAQGRSPFGRWFDDLDDRAAAKVGTAIARFQSGNLSDFKSVGGGVLERRIHFGPGYRIYFAMDGDQLIVLLGGGTKDSQQSDIQNAQGYWKDYLRRKEVPDD